MKRLLAFLGTVIILVGSGSMVQAASFADVPNDSWFKPFTDYLADQEIISQNNQFFPYRTITRGELAKMASLSGEKSSVLTLVDNTHQFFCDVPSEHWAAVYIDSLAEAGVINGSPTNQCNLGKNFFPDRAITRAEAVKILLNLYHITPGGNHNFSDVSTGLWYSSFIAAAVQAGLVNGYTDGSFKPNNFLTRAEMSKVLVRTIDHHQGNPPREPSQSNNSHIPTQTSGSTDNPPVPTPSASPSSLTPSSTPVSSPSPSISHGSIPAGAITIYSLGDSLTAGDGDESGQNGYPNRLLARINETHAGSHINNIGVSGIDSSTLVHDQLPQALAAHPNVVTVLVGSNDMWNDGWNDTDTSAETIQTYRDNMDAILSQLQRAGIKVFVGLVDDQSRRPVAQGSGMGLNDAQRARMSRIATAFNQIIQEKAAQYGATTADFFHTTIFTNPATLSDDGNHPNAAGYDAMTTVWFNAMRSQL